MSFQLTFLGYYSIKSPQLKKQTHSVKRRNWNHRERTAQADGLGWTAEADGFRWTAIADGPRRTRQPSASVGRPWKTAPAAGGCPWDRQTRPDVCRTRPWTSGRVTSLSPAAAEGYKYVPRGGSNVTTTVAGWAESVVAVAAERSRVRSPALAGALSHKLVI
jgi:hypothetical protein